MQIPMRWHRSDGELSRSPFSQSCEPGPCGSLPHAAGPRFRCITSLV